MVLESIARPTCKALSDNPLVGPLLSGSGNAGNMQKYLQYVKDFNSNVYTNAELIAEMETHASAIASAVRAHATLQGLNSTPFDAELTASAGTWQSFNLLAFMEARGEEVKKQLEALEAGTFPRGDASVPASESCQDWRVPPCPLGCVPVDQQHRRRHLLFGVVPDCPEGCVLAK